MSGNAGCVPVRLQSAAASSSTSVARPIMAHSIQAVASEGYNSPVFRLSPNPAQCFSGNENDTVIRPLFEIGTGEQTGVVNEFFDPLGRVFKERYFEVDGKTESRLGAHGPSHVVYNFTETGYASVSLMTYFWQGKPFCGSDGRSASTVYYYDVDDDDESGLVRPHVESFMNRKGALDRDDGPAVIVYNRNGTLETETFYTDGEVKTKRKYDNGVLQSEVTFKNNEAVVARCFNADGSVRDETPVA